MTIHDKMVNVGEDFCHRGLFRTRFTPVVSGLCDGVTDLSASRRGGEGRSVEGSVSVLYAAVRTALLPMSVILILRILFNSLTWQAC